MIRGKMRSIIGVFIIMALFSFTKAFASSPDENFWKWFTKNQEMLFAFEKNQENVFNKLAGHFDEYFKNTMH